MSVMQEYLKKYGNSTVSTPRSTAPVSSAGAGNGTMSEYLKWLEEEEERKRLQQAMTRNTLGLGKDDDEDEDIAPVDDSLLDFFQKGSFSDGFDWHDIPTAILGTAGDAALNVAKGALGIVEGVADLGVYGVAGVADALGHDEYAEGARRRASENLIDKVTGGAEDYLNKYSVLGRTSDAILQGVGQVGSIMATGGLGAGAGLGRAGVTALTTGLMGVSGVGSGMGEAYQSGATDEEALKYGLISGAADAISEMLFSGLGKGVNAIGFNQGLLGVDDLLAKKVSGMFSSQIAKNFAEFGIKASAEGLEEVIAGVAQAWGKWKTYESDEKFLDIVKDENLLEQFITGMVTSGIAQSGIVPGMKQGSLRESNQTGRDLVTGYTQNEQSVIDKAVENRIKAREENGQTVTHKDKTEIESEVKRLLDKGYLDADEIESILGGEEYTSVKNELSNFFASDDYKAYKQAEKAEADARAEFDPLVKMKQGDMTGEQIYRRDELKKILDESKVGELKSKVAPEATRIAQLRNKMRGNVQSMVQGTRMAESYNELARKQQKFQVDVNQYTDENAKKTVQSILDSGLGDNSNQFHETVDFLAKLSADKGVVFDLTNNEKLKGTEHYKEGYWTHGFVSDDGNIVLNYDSPRALNTTVGHEITHVMEKAGVYGDLQKAVFNYAISKEGQAKFDARLAEAREIYKGKKNTTAEGEVTADIIGEYLFTDYEFISNLSTSNRNVFQKIYDEIKYMVKIATAGSNEARELLKAKKMFDKAYRENVKGKPETAVTEETEVTEADNATAEEREFSDADVKYSIRKKDPPKNVIEGFKVFVVKDGKLFPPMVANPEGEGTPVGVWLDADVGGLSYDKDGNVKLNNRGRFKVKAGGKGTQGSGGDLAFRPGWHLGEYPDASQFGRENEEHLVPNKKGEMVPSKELFPYNFVWARCEVAADENYQLDAMSFGVNENGKFERSQAGLPYIPEDGYYKYRTNADPNTAPWIISGSIKVVEILNDDQVAAECAKHGVTPQQRQGFTYGAKSLQPEKRPGGKIDLSMFGLTEGMVTPTSENALNQIRATEDMADTRKAETLELLKTLPGYAKRQIDFDDENIIKEFGMNNQDVNEYRQMAEESGHSYLNDDKIYSGGETITEEQNEQGLDRVSETQYSLSKDTEFSQNAIKKNQEKLLVDAEAMTAAKELRERIASRMTEIKDRGLVALPEDMEGNTYIANSSYYGTEENTTICPRSLASEAFVDAVSEYLGRPLTVEEQIYISQDLQGRSLTPECTYCYVATDRKAYRAFLGEYINQRDSVIEKIKANPNADVSKSGDLYREFLNGRKDTKPMYNRFKMWVDAYQNGTPMVEASHLANISKLMGDIKEFGEDLKPQIVDAMKYAQSASWAKKRVSYVAYNGHILKWKEDRIKKLNSHYGLRMYSFSDFHPAFVLENMQMITDASVRGLKMLGYTKDTDFVEIFAPSGMNINISTFGFETDGNVYENNIIGAEWAKAQELRSQYPNVGITFVATNDTLVEWALDQDWIDVVIPYHLVRTGAEVAKAFGYTNYTSESSDTKTSEWKKGDKKSIAPTEHNNDFQTYMDALAKNHLNPRFERFKDNPNYMKLVNECRQSASQSKPVQPVFNEDAAMVALAKLEANGYYQPIGGSVDRMYEIASEVAEDMTKNIAPTKYSMSKDNEGNQLTREQDEFFKDSKIRDNEGNLRRVYHTTQNDFTVFDKSRKGEATDGPNTFLGFFFAESPDHMANFPEFQNGKTDAYYLDMKKPMDLTNLSRESFMDIVELTGGDRMEAAEVYDEELEAEKSRAILRGDNNTSLSISQLLYNMVGDYYHADFFDALKPNYDKLVAKGYDGVIDYLDEMMGEREFVVFDSNQAKLTTNTEPTSDPDIRYSLSNEEYAPIRDTMYDIRKMMLDISKIEMEMRIDQREEQKNGYPNTERKNRLADNLADAEEKYVELGESILANVDEHTDGQVQSIASALKLIDRSEENYTREQFVEDLNAKIAEYRQNIKETIHSEIERLPREQRLLFKALEFMAAEYGYSMSKEGAKQSIHGDYHVYGSDFGVNDPLADFAPVADTAPVSVTAENASIQPKMQLTDEKDAAPVADGIQIRTVKERLTAKLNNRQTELANIEKHRAESLKSLDEKIAKAQAALDSKKNKDTKVANTLKKRIERLQRLKADIDAGYAKRIADIKKSIDKTSVELEKDHTERDRYERAVARINAMLKHDTEALNAEYAQKKSELQSRLADKDSYISNTARELYDELRGLRKGVRASEKLGSLLDGGFGWGNLRSALSNVRYTPTDIVNPNSAAERAVRQLIEESFEEESNSIDDLDVELAEKIHQLEVKAEEDRKNARTANQRKMKMEEHSQFWKDLIGDTSTWKDLPWGLAYKTRTLRRILRKVVKDANGNADIAKADQIYDALETKYDHNEALLKKESQRLKETFFKLKLTHEEDAYAQMLGELRHNPDTTLTEDVVKEYYEKHKGKIDTNKVDRAIAETRRTYDELFDRLNAALREQGMKEIPYRQGYFPHFTNPKQNWFEKLMNWKHIDTEIPTSIAGLTDQFKPQRSWQSFNKQRMGDKTDYSLYQGLDTYIHGALDWIYHIDDLQSRRALENHLRYTHSDEGIKARIEEIKANDTYDADEAQKMIDAVLAEANNPLGGLVRELMNRTNTLANKKSSMDRGMEDFTNRKIYSTLTNINNRVTANQVVGSLSSALTNFIPMVQSWHQVSPFYTVRGLGDMIRASVKDDGMIAKSDFLTNRLIEEEKLYKTGWDKVSDKAAFMMNVVDGITSQTVWRSKYLQNLHEGMSESQAIKDADQFAKNLIAGRSRGNAPTIFDAKNPIVKIFTAFQLEVSNQYGYMFEDVPQDTESKARLVKGYATAFLGAYMYNALYSSLVGRDAAFDPLSILEDLLKDLFGDDEEEPEEIIMNLADNILEETPYIGGLLGGGRVPISSALPYSSYSNPFQSMLTDVTDGDWANFGKQLLKPLYYLAMPVAGGQIKKTAEGLGMFLGDHPISGSYTDSGKLRFPVEATFGNVLQAGLFGQYASQNAREYFDESRSPLGEKQIEEFMESGLPIHDYWEYREGLSGLSKLDEKADYIAGLDLPIDTKNLFINNIADRDEDIDLTGFDAYGDFEEFDFAIKYPEKYEIAQAVGGYEAYMTYQEGMKDMKLAEKVDYVAGLDLTVEQKNALINGETDRKEPIDLTGYENFSSFEEFEYAQKNPGGYAVAQAVGGYEAYSAYTDALGDIHGDKDEYGQTISGSRKEKVAAYIYSLDIPEIEQHILFKMEYNSDDDHNEEIIEYLNNRRDISAEEMTDILLQLGFLVDSEGNIYW